MKKQSVSTLVKQAMTLKSSQNNFASFLILLKKLYENIAESDYEEKVNIFILDAFRELLNSVSAEDIKEFLKNKVIAEIITRKYSTSLIYRQPIILFIYYLISKQRNNCKQYWPLSDKELRPLFSDLGISFDSAY